MISRSGVAGIMSLSCGGGECAGACFDTRPLGAAQHDVGFWSPPEYVMLSRARSDRVEARTMTATDLAIPSGQTSALRPICLLNVCSKRQGDPPCS